MERGLLLRTHSIELSPGVLLVEQYGGLPAGQAPRYEALGRSACKGEVGMRPGDACSGRGASPVGLSCLSHLGVCGLSPWQFSRSTLAPTEEVDGSLRGSRIYET
jgi:hypothetical protein